MFFDIAALLIANTLVAVAVGLASGRKSFLQLMLVYSAVLSLGAAYSLVSSMSDQAGAMPYLSGSDGEGYFQDAIQLALAGIQNYQELITANYAGYQIFLAACFIVFGAKLSVAMIANNALLLVSLLPLYRATSLLTASHRAGMLACVAFMLTSAHIYYALLLLKEPAIGLAFALMLLSLTEALKGRGFGLRPIMLFLVALAIVITMRGVLLLFVVALLGFLGSLILKHRSHLLVALVGVIAVVAPLAQDFTTHTLDVEFIADAITLNTVITSTLAAGDVDTGGVVGRVSGSYLQLPFFAKIPLFAIPTGLQLLLPFDFWSTAFLQDHASAFFARNLNPLWFLFVAVWALFAVANFRRIDDVLLRRFLLAGVSYYVMIAVIYGGAIPRYGAPALFFVYPAIGYWWDRSTFDPQTRTRVRIFFRRYYIAIPVLLLPYLALNLLRQA